MGVCILESKDGKSCLFCSTSDWAFGPVMNSAEEAEAFLQFLPGDPRTYKDADLESKYYDFVKQYVCECGDVADGKEGQDEEEDGKPVFGYPRTDGERFVCNFCQRKAAKADWRDEAGITDALPEIERYRNQGVK